MFPLSSNTPFHFHFNARKQWNNNTEPTSSHTADHLNRFLYTQYDAQTSNKVCIYTGRRKGLETRHKAQKYFKYYTLLPRSSSDVGTSK